MTTDEQRIKQSMTDNFKRMVDEFFILQCRYQAAIREVQTKLEVLDAEFQLRYSRNPIHHMNSRMKTIQSMMEKLQRKQHDISIESAVEHLMDIAGIRVVCSYVQDVYTIAKLLIDQDDIRLIRMRDYIANPKENGYRSLHLIIEVPVFLAEGRIEVPVEVQIRTIAMDLWASLEHALRYKAQGTVPESISAQLQQTATDIAEIDQRMQSIYDHVEALAAPAKQPGENK